MEIDSEVAFRAVRKNGARMLSDDTIETIKLIRSLDSEEVISPEFYEEMTDKAKNWSNTDSLEHLLKRLRTDIQNNGQLFVSFVKVLNGCGYTAVAKAIIETYNTLAQEAKLSLLLEMSETGEVCFNSETANSTFSSERDSTPKTIEAPKLMFESKGYEEFSDLVKYGEPKLANLLDWVIYLIPSKWYTVGLKLGFSVGVLDGIKADLSFGGDPKRMFQKVLTSWSDQFPSQYNWTVLLQILASPSIGEMRLANQIASNLKGEPYFGPEQPQFQDAVVAHTSLQQADLEGVHEVLVKVIESNYHRLSNAIDSSLHSFARMLLEADIISRDVCKKAEYNSIMQSFTAGLTMKNTLKELEGDCRSFVKALKTVGGPGRHAAQRIAQQWKEALQTKMGISFNVE